MSKKELNIKAIRCYQSVFFHGTMHTSFNNLKNPNNPREEVVSLTYMPELHAVEVKDSKDHVIVPLTNVSSINLYSKIDEEVAERAPKLRGEKRALKPTEIKRPK